MSSKAAPAPAAPKAVKAKDASATPKATLTLKDIGSGFSTKNVVAGGTSTLKYKRGDFNASLAASDATVKNIKVRAVRGGHPRRGIRAAVPSHWRLMPRDRMLPPPKKSGPRACVAPPRPADDGGGCEPEPQAQPQQLERLRDARGQIGHRTHRSLSTCGLAPTPPCPTLYPLWRTQSLRDVVATLDYKVPKGIKGVTVNTKYELGPKKYTVGATWDGKVTSRATTVKATYSNKDNKLAGEATLAVTKTQKANVVFNQDKVGALCSRLPPCAGACGVQASRGLRLQVSGSHRPACMRARMAARRCMQASCFPTCPERGHMGVPDMAAVPCRAMPPPTM